MNKFALAGAIGPEKPNMEAEQEKKSEADSEKTSEENAEKKEIKESEKSLEERYRDLEKNARDLAEKNRACIGIEKLIAGGGQEITKKYGVAKMVEAMKTGDSLDELVKNLEPDPAGRQEFYAGMEKAAQDLKRKGDAHGAQALEVHFGHAKSVDGLKEKTAFLPDALRNKIAGAYGKDLSITGRLPEEMRASFENGLEVLTDMVEGAAGDLSGALEKARDDARLAEEKLKEGINGMNADIQSEIDRITGEVEAKFEAQADKMFADLGKMKPDEMQTTEAKAMLEKIIEAMSGEIAKAGELAKTDEEKRTAGLKKMRSDMRNLSNISAR